MTTPFDLSAHSAYAAWRRQKLANYPVHPEALRVPVNQLANPSSAELDAIHRRVRAFNLALVAVDPQQLDRSALLAFGQRNGLVRTDTNLLADADAISVIASTSNGGNTSARQQKGDYIPYTNRPLSWHTDGYYNSAERQIQAWTLFCVQPARSGGANQLIDHEILYIRLRDDSPRHIEALSHPDTLTIPANIQNGRVIRPASSGPVFSVRAGQLHMRYSARSRHALWRGTPDTDAARQALDELFSTNPGFTFNLKLAAGEGLITNNVPHNRTGFDETRDTQPPRTLFRVRYLDRIRLAGH